MSDLVIGCPVRSRGWIMGQWIDHVATALDKVGMSVNDVTFAFALPGGDDSLSPVFDAVPAEKIYMCFTDEDPGAEDKRNWRKDRYAHMARVRNLLLEHVQKLEPRWFLSLDSDVLVHPDSLGHLFETIHNPARGFDAVGGKVYMTAAVLTHGTRRPALGREAPSYGMLVNDYALQRDDYDGVIRVDVVMAMVLMGPAAYHLPYRPHPNGEDVGFGLAAREAGVVLGWDGRALGKHIFDPMMLEITDPRVGF